MKSLRWWRMNNLVTLRCWCVTEENASVPSVCHSERMRTLAKRKTKPKRRSRRNLVLNPMKATLCNFPRSRSEHIIFAPQIYHREAISFDRKVKHHWAHAPSHVSFSSEREESRATRFGDYNERLIRLPSAATFSHRRRQTEAALFRI